MKKNAIFYITLLIFGANSQFLRFLHSPKDSYDYSSYSDENRDALFRQIPKTDNNRNFRNYRDDALMNRIENKNNISIYNNIENKKYS